MNKKVLKIVPNYVSILSFFFLSSRYLNHQFRPVDLLSISQFYRGDGTFQKKGDINKMGEMI